MADSPNIDSLIETKTKLEEEIKNLQAIGIPNPADAIINMLESKGLILTKRQISKKFLILSSQKFNPPMTEDDAQLFIYGKVYYKDGKLFDNDKADPACVAQPGDEDYQPPIDIDNHPLCQKIQKMINDFLDSLKQFGAKLGEFIVAIPKAIVTIATSLIAMVSSAIILPFGSGIPAALTAVQTMMATISELQAKIAQFLPFINPIVDAVGLVLDKIGQMIISLLNTIFGAVSKIVGALNAVLGLLGPVMALFSSTKKKSDEQKIAVEAKADPTEVDKGQSVKLSATASGGDWSFKYEWTDSNGSVVSNEAEATITPSFPSMYKCKVIDGKGSIAESTVKVKVNVSLADIINKVLK
jgi:hypothetical protein